MKPRILFVIAMAAVLSLLFGCVLVNRAVESEFPHAPLTPTGLSTRDNSEAPIQPIVPDNTLDPREVALGQGLFYDTSLSRNNTISCASCHDLATGGTDRRRVSIGMDQRQGTRNAPTVFNCSLNYRQFWDGRAASLMDQLDGPLKSAREMDSTWAEVVTKLQREDRYVREFRALYPDGLQLENIKKALVVFERSLTTPNARFDQYLRGDKNALTAREQSGYHLFITVGCIACHQGVNIGGNMMQPFGVIENPYAHSSGQVNSRITSRHELILSDAAESAPLFRVPSLRNIALTAPYFHDGSAPSLRVAVEVMGYSQLGRHLTDEEVDQLLQFLNSLTGEYRGKTL